MAERRMFAKTIIDSDAFIDMPLSTQALYFHLSMRADDDGFINNPKKIQRMIGASDDDLKVLIAKRYVLVFDSGVIVIKHWKIHNYIRNDRYHQTVYIDEKSQIEVKDNGAYTEKISNGIPSGDKAVYQMDTEVRLGKDSIGKDSIDKEETDSPISELDPCVQEAFKSFMAMRKRIKKPMTDNAIKRMVAKLKNLSQIPSEQVRILNRSEDSCWSDIYAIDNSKKQSKKGLSGYCVDDNEDDMPLPF